MVYHLPFIYIFSLFHLIKKIIVKKLFDDRRVVVMFNRGIANVSKKRGLTRKAWRKIEWGWVVTFKKTMALELIGTDI